MPTTNISQRVTRICGLLIEEVTKLEAAGIKTEEDLSFVKFVDLPTSDVALIPRRKLEAISLYLARGNVFVKIYHCSKGDSKHFYHRA